jgi:hypothetical protein
MPSNHTLRVSKNGQLFIYTSQLLGIKVGHAFREDFGGAILDRTNDAEQYPTADAAPRAIVYPCLAFEGLFTADVTLAQWSRGEAIALGAAPPTQPGQGKAPHDRAFQRARWCQGTLSVARRVVPCLH